MNFSAFLRGPSALGVTSRALQWDGFLIEEHCLAAGALDEAVLDHHVVALWQKRGVGEHRSSRAGFLRYDKQPGMITIIPPGIAPPVRQHSASSLVLLGLSPGFERAVREEMDARPHPVGFRTGFHDASLRHLLTLLFAEARQAGLSGRLYAEHLAHALTLRLLASRGTEPRAAGALPRPALRRVLDRMHALDAEPDLRSLAAESGYSRAHFLRMFRAAMGVTPHRYLMQLRLERAQRELARGRASLTEVAFASGFASHSHMSRVFRQLLGMTPSDYRRGL